MDRSGRGVLVVDDDATIRELVSVLLDGEGYEVRTAVNGRDALDALERWRPDVIVLDMLMPVMDGAAFLAAQQVNPRLVHIPTVVMSASFKLDHAGERSPASALLPKPFRIDDLLAHVNALCGGACPALPCPDRQPSTSGAGRPRPDGVACESNRGPFDRVAVPR